MASSAGSPAPRWRPGRTVCHDTGRRQVNEGAEVLDRIDHVGIACHDLAAKIAWYESVFDLTVVSREVNEEQGVREAMLRVSAAPGGAS
jgi:4-hydroxyphenylpyruvate dioxygenase-like putative hemolysin